ncbi:MAG: zinc ribbon domain-containing protein [Clostridia bacterium]|nr:zinc ribbon domain-containing protein [Clostridia bacterium]
MKCPKCYAELPDGTARCTRCGSPLSQTRTTAMPYAYTASAAPVSAGYAAPAAKRGKTGGEIAAIVTAIIVSVLSVIAAFVILFAFLAKSAEKVASSYDLDDIGSLIGEGDGDSDYGDFGGLNPDLFGDYGGYGMDGFDDEDSWEDFLRQYSSLFGDYYGLFGESSMYPASLPAAEHTPVSFNDSLYSFSDGYINTDYTVSLEEAYRGDAALKLLEGAKLPEWNDDQELYLVKYKLNVTKQDTEAFVPVGSSAIPAAYAAGENGAVGKQFPSLSSISYRDNNKLIKTGEEADCWMAFVVDKTEERPLIEWKPGSGEYFRFSRQAVTDAAGLTAGAAYDPEA